MNNKIYKRIIKLPSEHYLLIGPRGTGKTTLLNSNYEKKSVLNLLDHEKFRYFSAKPERFIEWVQAQENKIIIIDEVQKIPELLDSVHLLIEEKKDRQFILTGSSARKLKRGTANLLAGRALDKKLYPFMACELGSDFNLQQALLYGMIPSIVNGPSAAEKIRAYISLYIREEILMEGIIRKIGNFNRFLESVSFSHGSIINVNNIAEDSGVNRQTIINYIEILEDLLLAFKLPIFNKRAKRRTIKRSKFYFFDTGVFRAIRPQGPLDAGSDIDGPSLEGLVAQHLTAWTAYREKNEKVFYWRTTRGLEVDFIIYGPDTFCAIEVKNSAKINRFDLKALKEFKKDYPEAGTLLLYRGSEKYIIDGINCLPCEIFLKKLNPGSELMRK